MESHRKKIFVAGEYGHLGRFRERRHLCGSVCKMSSSKKILPVTVLSYNQAKHFASITLLVPIIALSGPVIPILLIKKVEAEVGQRTGKRLLHLGFKPMYLCLNPEPVI